MQSTHAPDAADPSSQERHPELEAVHLSSRQAQAFVRLVETAAEVKRRFQFFVWLQSHLQVLLPHSLAVCGAYSRQRKQLQFEVFNSIALAPSAMEALAASDSPLLQRAAKLWADGDGRATVSSLVGDESPWADLPLAAELARAGLRRIFVHAVARPDRRHEIETLFLLADAAQRVEPGAARVLELALPHLHATFLRTQGVEREMGVQPARVAAAPAERVAPAITAREAQILHWVREGKSNHEIGELLGISSLTVKNHIQKVLRKLGAKNRAHAVTIAARMRVLPGAPATDAHGNEPE